MTNPNRCDWYPPSTTPRPDPPPPPPSTYREENFKLRDELIVAHDAMNSAIAKYAKVVAERDEAVNDIAVAVDLYSGDRCLWSWVHDMRRKMCGLPPLKESSPRMSLVEEQSNTILRLKTENEQLHDRCSDMRSLLTKVFDGPGPVCEKAGNLQNPFAYFWRETWLLLKREWKEMVNES